MDTTSRAAPLLALVLFLASCTAQDKWVWDGRTAKSVRTDSGRLRYGVYEPEELQSVYNPGFRPPPPDLPPLVRPPSPHQRPDYPRPPPPPPGGQYRPIEKPELDPTRFEKCKCVHSFNCKSPGLLFGSCDAGKKYCCEKSIRGGGSREFVPDNVEPEVLAGPGGPVDHLKKPNGPRPGLGPYGGERPAPRPGSYGIRPDGSLGAGGPFYRPGPRY